MNQEEHLSMARELMRRADQESAADGGNEMIAAEFLWGAFAHCLITVAHIYARCRAVQQRLTGVAVGEV